MKVTPRSLRAELPEPAEVRGPAPPELAPEEMRLSSPRPAERSPDVALVEPAPEVPEGGFEALAAAVGALGDEEGDARALELLDASGRAQLAPRLSAVRDMAQALRELLGMRREATDRVRGGGQG